MSRRSGSRSNAGGMSAGQAKRSSIGPSTVRFAAESAGEGESDDEYGGDDNNERSRKAARVSRDVDDEELILVAGGSGATKRKQSSGSARGRKKQRPSGSDDAAAASVDNEGSSASSLVNALKSRYTRDDSTPLSLMSSVSRRENATHLSYFEQLAQPARKSNNTLKDIPKLTEEQRARIASSLPDRHAAAHARLHAHHVRCMRQWFVSLSLGCFNLLCYGYGSKKRLLNEFARTWLTDAPVIVFNAYTPGAHVKTLLNCLTRDLMHLPTQTFRDLHAHVEFVREWFRRDEMQARGGGRRAMRAAHAARGQRGAGLVREEEQIGSGAAAVWSEDEELETEKKMMAAAGTSAAAASSYAAAASSSSSSSSSALLPRVYIVLHNLDGPALRSEVAQSSLALLASIPQIRLIASVDHIRSGWLWDRDMIGQFNFTAVDATTFKEYDLEHASNSGGGGGAAAGGSGEAVEGALVESSLRGRAAGITNVLSSLTPNHRKVLDVLAREQLTPNNPNCLRNGAAGGGGLVERQKLYALCEESMLVSSLDSFNRLMNELRDHALLEEKIVDRTKVLTIPYPPLIIRRHILGEQPEDSMVLEAAAQAQRLDEAEQQKANGRDASAFARAMGTEAEEEEDGDVEAELDAADNEEDE